MGRIDELLTAQGETLSELQTALDSAEEAAGQLGDDVEVLYDKLDTLRVEMAEPNRVTAAFERRLIFLQIWEEILNPRKALALARANLERVIVLSPEPEAEALIAI
jgi:uncharacterized coiled-coil protein SlyX